MRLFRSILVLLLLGNAPILHAQELLRDNISGLNYLMKKGTENGNTVILIHGYGSNEKDLFSWANSFPISTHVIAPRGPIKYKEGSYSWYDIEFKNDGNHQRNLHQALSSHGQLLRLIESLKRQDIAKGKIVVGGFSQGAILSMHMALNNPDAIDGIIAFSGMLLSPESQPNTNLLPHYQKLKAFYSHGSNDPLISLEKGVKAQSVLKQAGIKVTFKEFPVAHTISQQAFKDMVEWYTTNYSR